MPLYDETRGHTRNHVYDVMDEFKPPIGIYLQAAALLSISEELAALNGRLQQLLDGLKVLAKDYESANNIPHTP